MNEAPEPAVMVTEAWRETFPAARVGLLVLEDVVNPPTHPVLEQSDLNNCNNNFRELAEYVKRGVWQAGGTPLEFPTISLGEQPPASMRQTRGYARMHVEHVLQADKGADFDFLTGPS
jgi:dihydroxyacid dehydratase/phosphogluconate dehydratase